MSKYILVNVEQVKFLIEFPPTTGEASSEVPGLDYKKF